MCGLLEGLEQGRPMSNPAEVWNGLPYGHTWGASSSLTMQDLSLPAVICQLYGQASPRKRGLGREAGEASDNS